MEMDRKTIALYPCHVLSSKRSPAPRSKDLKETLDSEWRMTGGGALVMALTSFVGAKPCLTKVLASLIRVLARPPEAGHVLVECVDAPGELLEAGRVQLPEHLLVTLHRDCVFHRDGAPHPHPIPIPIPNPVASVPMISSACSTEQRSSGARLTEPFIEALGGGVGLSASELALFLRPRSGELVWEGKPISEAADTPS
ncbi:hypothetical protein F7725_007349 [Dissostichus mawsoni]|uniref:Uncharacterized protein n=1 Tax=Dissostichus mawsoni TaxID=36200 RepID=A0A7J5XY82_DISMA|nr:hypothetical protein F7725_007349 [Dissostichus mawsoni]